VSGWRGGELRRLEPGAGVPRGQWPGNAAPAPAPELEVLAARALAPALRALADKYRCPDLAALALVAHHGGAVDVRLEDLAALARRSVPTVRRRFRGEGAGTSRTSNTVPGLLYRPGTGGVDGNTLSRFALGAHRMSGPAGRHGNPATGRAPARYRRKGEGWRGQTPRRPERPSEALPFLAPVPDPLEPPEAPEEPVERPAAGNVTGGDKGARGTPAPAEGGSHAWVRGPHQVNPERITPSVRTQGVRGGGVWTSDAGEGRSKSGSPEPAGEVLRRLAARYASGSRPEPGPGRGVPLRGGLGAGEGEAPVPEALERAAEELEAARGASALERAAAGDASPERPELDRLTAAGARALRTGGDGAAERFRDRRARERKPWRDGSSRAPWRARLQWAAVLDPVHLREAERQARRLADVFRAEGAIPGVQHGADPARWVPVLATLAAAAGWEAAMRLIRAGLASGPSSSGRWEGWRRCLERDPRYALRRTFLEAARWGRRIPRGGRWEDGFAWEPATPELAGERERWLCGDGPPPRAPGGDRAAREAVRELLAGPPGSEPAWVAGKREQEARREARRMVGAHRPEELPEVRGAGVVA